MRTINPDTAVNETLRISDRREWCDLRALLHKESKVYG